MIADPWNAFITRVEPAGSGSGPGPLSGRTLAVKDLFDTAGVCTTYGSGIYAEHVPDRTAVAVQRLLDAGAVMVGKTHLPEFAWGVLGDSQWYGTCHNPAASGEDDRGLVERFGGRCSQPASASSRSARTPAARSDFRLRRARS